MTCPMLTKLLDKVKSFISEPDSCWVPTLWFLWSDQHTYCFHCVEYNVMRCRICVTYLQECLKSSYRGCNNTAYHQHNWVNLPRHILSRILHLLLGGDCLCTLYSNGDNCPQCLIPFEHRNVIDNELLRHTVNSCPLSHKINNLSICSFFISV